ncbi:arginine decarboxylase [marine bacterium AO1-C]|nr:arginine decarboxylase [marine bacterium AO1-C]
MKNIIKTFVIGLIASMAMSSCTAVKSYQKMYLNDSDMKLAGRKVAKVETYFQFYREGAAGANGGKTGGGCGCN